MSKHLLSSEINYKQRASRAKTEVSSRWRTSWPHPHSSWSTWCPGRGWRRRQWRRPWSPRLCRRCRQGCRPWRRTRPTISHTDLWTGHAIGEQSLLGLQRQLWTMDQILVSWEKFTSNQVDHQIKQHYVKYIGRQFGQLEDICHILSCTHYSLGPLTSGLCHR